MFRYDTCKQEFIVLLIHIYNTLLDKTLNPPLKKLSIYFFFTGANLKIKESRWNRNLSAASKFEYKCVAKIKNNCKIIKLF